MGALMAQPWVAIVVLAVAGVGSVASMVLSLRNAKQQKTSGVNPPVARALNHPLLQHMLGQLAVAAQKTQHAALDAAVLKLAPWAAPFMPMVNGVADGIDSKLLGGVPALPQAGDPATRPIIAFLESQLAQLKGVKQ